MKRMLRFMVVAVLVAFAVAQASRLVLLMGPKNLAVTATDTATITSKGSSQLVTKIVDTTLLGDLNGATIVRGYIKIGAAVGWTAGTGSDSAIWFLYASNGNGLKTYKQLIDSGVSATVPCSMLVSMRDMTISDTGGSSKQVSDTGLKRFLYLETYITDTAAAQTGYYPVIYQIEGLD